MFGLTDNHCLVLSNILNRHKKIAKKVLDFSKKNILKIHKFDAESMALYAKGYLAGGSSTSTILYDKYGHIDVFPS